VIDNPACHKDCFLQRETCVSSNQLKRPVWSKESSSPHWKTAVCWSILFKKQLNSHRVIIYSTLQLLTEMDFFKTYMCSSIKLKELIWNKE
jgi:hypothetical protein